jgi:hypothetical protein
VAGFQPPGDSAADIGADGVIFTRENPVVAEQSGAWAVGRNGGFGLPSNIQRDAVYHGDAIRFKTQN